MDWIPTTIGAAGECVYGPPSASCDAEAIAGLGCIEAPGPCSNEEAMLYRRGRSGGIEVVVAPICTPADEYCFVSGEPAVPECDCGCDPAFPGI